MAELKDSGTRREFDTGAVRDIQEGKGRCDLLPFYVVSKLYEVHSRTVSIIFDSINWFVMTGDYWRLFCAVNAFVKYRYGPIGTIAVGSDPIANALLEVAKHFEDGARKYGDNNWRKGIPARCYIDSAVRHLLKYLRGDDDEPHDRAFMWNILCCIWTCMNKPELNDYKKEEAEDDQK